MAALTSRPAPAAQEIVRFCISESLVNDISLNDARAAMSVWMRRIVQDLQLEVRIAPDVFEREDRIQSKLRLAEVDIAAFTLPEYRRLQEWVDTNQFVVPGQKTQLEYVLLVRSGSGITSPADLRGRRLVTLHSPLTAIAPAWLATVLGAAGLDGPERFFGALSTKTKPSQVILPVFFGQAEACLTTRSSFLTMSELNPQIPTRLQPIAVSPPIVPSVQAFRKGYQGSGKEKVFQALAGLSSSAAGRQVLTLFQVEDLTVKGLAHLKSSLDILTLAERLARPSRPPGKEGPQ
ncbi:MAG: PhnD/SsuA/transferrin family substrate-binding protein [Acidobacteria bacterium]|nr:PhnD/SsuA/transferrin family substrate-binding protein [Acidobacteriota bacterium]